MYKIKIIQQNHKNLPAMLIAISFIITSLAIINGLRFNTGYALEIGKPSNVKIKAPHDIENRFATDKLKQIAYNSVQTIYERNKTVEDTFNTDLDAFFNETLELRLENKSIKAELDSIPLENSNLYNQNKAYYQTKKDALDSQLNNLLTSNNLSIYLSEKQKVYILNLSDEDFESIIRHSKEISQNIFELGIKTSDLEKLFVTIKEELEDTTLNKDTINLTFTILSTLLKPNLIADVDATETARLQKQDEVKPVIILKDQTIINDGDIVTEEIYEVLNDLSYIQKDYKGVLFLFFGALCITVVIFIFALNYIYIYKIKFLKTIKGRLLFFTLYNMCIIFMYIYGTWLSKNLHGFFMPILVFVLLISILFESKLGIIMNIVFATLAMFIIDLQYNYYIYFILTGITIAINSKYFIERNKTISIALIISTTNAFLFFGISLYTTKTSLQELSVATSLAFINGFLTVIIAIGTLPLWENLFNAVTVVRLLDLTNPNNPLLTRLAMEAPGTYHHSLIVANLSEIAAKAINAGSILARVGGYYHDIGKLKSPLFFSENQGDINPHDFLDPYKSVEILKDHITYGLELAEANNLPYSIKDIILMHHGNTLIKFFYNKAVQLYGEDVKESDFRYKNPIPNSKEIGIIMLADTCEAAVRSILPKVESIAEIDSFIKKLFDDKLNDIQLQDSGLTLNELDTIRNSFLRVFKSMYHERIAYPELKQKNKN